ncbi:MAG TPA: MOSC domain-containing protein [Thermoplasmata archaeon]|nr:MOSC domain-containing protein [Thermoplasmata archaeon]
MYPEPTVLVLSVNVGTPALLGTAGGAPVVSGIVKSPVRGPVRVVRNNLEGDRQADLRVHGGEEKAVYLYPSEHYAHWRGVFPHRSLEWGAFGENLTTEGLIETGVHQGDRLRIGSAELEVTRPRFPCSKLALRFGTDRMVRWFLDSGRTGFYLKIREEGVLQSGDPITLRPGSPRGPRLDALVRARQASD